MQACTKSLISHARSGSPGQDIRRRPGRSRPIARPPANGVHTVAAVTPESGPQNLCREFQDLDLGWLAGLSPIHVTYLPIYTKSEPKMAHLSLLLDMLFLFLCLHPRPRAHTQIMP